MLLASAGASTAAESVFLEWDRTGPVSYAVQFSDGTKEVYGGTPAFILVLRDPRQFDWLLSVDAYSAALSFIRGEYDVCGDVAAAVRFHLRRRRPRWRECLYSMAARGAPRRIENWFQTRARAAANVRFHYDRPIEFYRQFLDTRMVYSCAYFRHRLMSLEEAQVAKLGLICRKLDLRAGDRFLDIGCGWGALLNHAAEHYGACATGCTLSQSQAEHARASAKERGAAGVQVHEKDFRNITGRFDKIASVGMFEHVGRRRLRRYFEKVYDLLEPGGLFLNHGIVRPELVADGAETLFLQRRVFPGGELAHLSDVVRAAEISGFEVLDLENLRPHYALTCRAWVERLQRNAAACLEKVDGETYRTWLLYLAGSAVGFEEGFASVCQLLLARRTGPARRLTRDYMCIGESRRQPSSKPDG